MNSKFVTNAILASIAASLILPQISPFLNDAYQAHQKANLEAKKVAAKEAKRISKLTQEYHTVCSTRNFNALNDYDRTRALNEERQQLGLHIISPPIFSVAPVQVPAYARNHNECETWRGNLDEWIARHSK